MKKENKKKTGKKVKVEGWYEKMCWKTLYRAAYGDITIDSQKIDSDYMRLKEMERQAADVQFDEEVSERANKEAIDIDGEVIDDADPDAEPVQDEGTEKQDPSQPTGTDGPGY